MTYKDNFSAQAALYAQSRPHYPLALIDWVVGNCAKHRVAWDVGCGNGQVALALSPYFAEVYATDASEAQIAQALPRDNVRYRVCVAQESGLDEASVDLITVGQALHWFDFEAFYAEVRRVAAPNATIAAWGYGLCHISEEIDEVVHHFYHHILGQAYWDIERRHIDHHYHTIPFPFTPLESPCFEIRLSYSLAQLYSYLDSWSAVQKYHKDKGINPRDLIAADLAGAWGANDTLREVVWEIYLLAGTVQGS